MQVLFSNAHTLKNFDFKVLYLNDSLTFQVDSEHDYHSLVKNINSGDVFDLQIFSSTEKKSCYHDLTNPGLYLSPTIASIESLQCQHLTFIPLPIISWGHNDAAILFHLAKHLYLHWPEFNSPAWKYLSD